MGAVLFAAKHNGRHYQIEQAGTRRLLRINHRSETQSIGGWGPTFEYYDDMAAAVIASDQATLCLLGMGGATIARRLREMGWRGEITGVENDEFLLSLGVKWFDADKYVDEIVLADARRFCSASGRKFGVVIDDVFVDSNKRVKPAARRIVRHGGTLIENNFPQKGITVTVC